MPQPPYRPASSSRPGTRWRASLEGNGQVHRGKVPWKSIGQVATSPGLPFWTRLRAHFSYKQGPWHFIFPEESSWIPGPPMPVWGWPIQRLPYPAALSRFA